MTLPFVLRARAATVLLLALPFVLLLAACGEATDPSIEPDTDDTAEPDDTDDTDDTAEPDSVTPTANLDGCVEEPVAETDYFPEQAEFSHAEYVRISYHQTYKVLEVDLAFADEPARYVLVQCGLEAPPLEDDLVDATVVEVPITTAVTTTTTTLPHYDALGAVDTLVGVGTPDFVSTPSVLDRIESGAVEGYSEPDGSPQVERVVAVQPDVLTVDGFGETVLTSVQRLSDAGVPVLLNADFRETSLLGRSEWVKVTAALLNAEAAAESLFADIERRYDDVAAAVADVTDRPRVLSDMPFQGTWFAPGGQSVTAKAVADAGGEYVFADDPSPASVAFDLETVLERGTDADVWIAAGSVSGTIDDLVAMDERFAEIRAVQDGAVWAGDASTSPGGGNGRFEAAYLRADVILADLATILHPDLVDHDPVFYGPVPEG